MSSASLSGDPTRFQIVGPIPLSGLKLVDEEDLEAELEALGDEFAMEELKEEEGTVPRYCSLAVSLLTY
jgi:hypothetical protein